MNLIKYDAACRALAEAKSIDEAREIVSRAEALKAYARQAKNRDLEIDARDIRIRAERRMGEIILELRKERTFKNGRPRLIEDLGIGGSESASAQRLALMADKDFEHAVSTWRETARVSKTVPAPLRAVRNPSEHISKAKRSRARPIDQSDALDQFRCLDGRAIADCLVGELRRLESLTRRQLLALKAIRGRMPVANPDSLATLRVTFRDDVLLALLRDVWEGEGATPIFPDSLSGLPSQRGGYRVGAGRKRHGTSAA